jgi:hypothetical protein
LTITGGVIAGVAVAVIVGIWRLVSKRWTNRKGRSEDTAAAPAGYPVRLTCRDVTDYAPGSGYREIMEIEIFNHSETAVRVKGFGLKIEMTGPHDTWTEYVQAVTHPRIELPVRLVPNDGLEGVIDHESIGEDLYDRGIFDFIGESTGYVDVVGFGEGTAGAAS